MKRRANEHIPGPLSRPFEADTLTAVMIPGANLMPGVVLKRLNDGGDGDEREALRFGLLMAFSLWDDPNLEWESSADPDAVFNMDPDQLRSLADALFDELNKPSAMKLGVSASSVILLGLRASTAWLPSSKAVLDKQRSEDAGDAGKEAVLAGE